MPNSKKHYRHVLCIALIFAFRMLGLFMLLPIFSVYADELHGATHTLMGLGFGIYGLTQAIFQIPLGYISDKVGRKEVILFGLALFALGSVICGLATNIYILILGRAIQGSGAIGSTLIALIADITPEETRTKSMALLGMMIGMSFAIAVVTGPIVARYFGFHGVFHCMTFLALCGIALTIWVIPTPSKESYHPDVSPDPSLFRVVLKNAQLNYLNVSIFIQHFVFTSVFYAIPTLLEQHLKIQWHFYLPIMFFSFLLSVPLIVIGEKKKKIKQVFFLTISMVTASQCMLLGFHQTLLYLSIGLFLYFIAFNALEACLPSSVTKAVDTHAKGTAMGIYSMSQFLGIFAGGSISGRVFQFYGVSGIFGILVFMAVIWLSVTALALSGYTCTKHKQRFA